MFSQAIIKCFKNIFSIKARASRKEYWFYFLFFTIVWLCSAVINFSRVYDGGSINDIFSVIFLIVLIFLLIPLFTVSVRRLHDIGKSGFWMFFILIPVVGLIFYIVWMASPAFEEENSYGKIDVI